MYGTGLEERWPVQEEIDYLLSVEDLACTLTDLQKEGKLPLRVTHNDTKIIMYCSIP